MSLQSSRSATTVNVLFVTSEIYPLVKTGGLADVSGSLPAAVRQLGVDIRILVPGYPQIMAGLPNKWVIATGIFEFGEVRLLSAIMPDSEVPVIVIDYPPFYDRPAGPYQNAVGDDWPDNALRFGLLSRVGALLASDSSPLPWRPDVVHCNDWQSGLTPVYLHSLPGKKAASLLTIHNLAYQGVFPPETVKQIGLPPKSFDVNGVEYYDNMSFLKGGIYFADHITTVSPTYAAEIQSAPLGFGMEGLLATRRAHLSGILNGIDDKHWNPTADTYLTAHYNTRKLSGKAVNKNALQQQLGLEENPRVPLLGVISRITYQKGLDLLLETSQALLAQSLQIVLLGAGDNDLEARFKALESQYPGKISVTIGYSESLAHRIEAGADIFLMPSRYEPCGLNQMYSMRYGTPPLVFATGGLADTVTDLTPQTDQDESATGFVFHQQSAQDFLDTVQRAITTFRNKKTWRRLQRNGMCRDFTWRRSANDYLALYQRLVGGNGIS